MVLCNLRPGIRHAFKETAYYALLSVYRRFHRTARHVFHTGIDVGYQFPPYRGSHHRKHAHTKVCAFLNHLGGLDHRIQHLSLLVRRFLVCCQFRLPLFQIGLPFRVGHPVGATLDGHHVFFGLLLDLCLLFQHLLVVLLQVVVERRCPVRQLLGFVPAPLHVLHALLVILLQAVHVHGITGLIVCPLPRLRILHIQCLEPCRVGIQILLRLRGNGRFHNTFFCCAFAGRSTAGSPTDKLHPDIAANCNQ